MALPALLFAAVNLGSGAEVLRGWATPTATDIAFALAVLAVISTHLPAALRTFRLTLAVVGDLLAITVIAVFYTRQLHPWFLLAALVPLALYALLMQRRVRSPWLLLPLATCTWALVHASRIHATVAGVLLAFVVPVHPSPAEGRRGAGPGLSEQLEHLVRPLSAGFVVPVFAFFAAGVTLGGWAGLAASLTDPVTLGIIAGLVVGKAVGIFGATYLVARFTRASLDDDLRWVDVLGLAILGGMGFTVSLLIGELAYPAGSHLDDQVKVGVLAGSLIAAVMAAVILRARNRTYRRLFDAEEEKATLGDTDTDPA